MYCVWHGSIRAIKRISSRRRLSPGCQLGLTAIAIDCRVWKSKPRCTVIGSLAMACFSAVTAKSPGNLENQRQRFRGISSLFKEGRLKEAVDNMHHMCKGTPKVAVWRGHAASLME